MKTETKELGTVEINDNEIIQFPSGLYGFEETRKFVLLKDDDDSNPFMWLQSVDAKEPYFAVIDPLSLYADYQPYITDDDRVKIGLDSGGDLKLLVIVTIPNQNYKNTVLNLKCPVIINPSNHKAAQIIQDDDRYPMRYPLFGGSKSSF